MTPLLDPQTTTMRLRPALRADCFDASATLAAVEGECCTSLYGVPTMFIAQLEHPE
jgi:acyl-CoA synthetase (AMP-forming)/AMP-acid ligase II